jgi:hypothetical protein
MTTTSNKNWGWELLPVSDSLPPRRVFARALDAIETAFYWDGEFAGTADTAERTSIVIEPVLHLASPDFDAERFRAIWIALKQRFPLLAARVEERDGGTAPHFVVDEAHTMSIQFTEEFEYIGDADADTVQRVLDRALNSTERRFASARTLSALSVLRRIDAPAGTYDFITHASHAIVDGMASATLARTLCELLARWPASLADPIPDLAARLRKVPALDALYPVPALSPARRRWRCAIASVIHARRAAALRGGHTLPGVRTPETPRTPARSCTLRVPLSRSHTAAVVSAARAHSVSVAHVLPALAHTALARVLHSRRAQGEIGDAEWDRRCTSHVNLGGPLNVRPFLEPKWVAGGGTGEVHTAVCLAF